MRRLGGICAIVTVLMTNGIVSADFYAMTNEIGYQGTIWNITDGTGPWTTSTGRDAALYTTVGVPGSPNYNYLLSNWSEHGASNTNNSFLQLAETGNPSVDSAVGSWDSTLKTFTVTVTGHDAPYPWSRFWQPDNGVAWGVTFTEYRYSFTATFASEAVVSDGWYVDSGSPLSIDGTFTGKFEVTADVNKNPITNGDLYGFDIAFSKSLFLPLDDRDAYGNVPVLYSDFGAPVPVPVPGAVLLGVLGLGYAGRKLRMCS